MEDFEEELLIPEEEAEEERQDEIKKQPTAHDRRRSRKSAFFRKVIPYLVVVLGALILVVVLFVVSDFWKKNEKPTGTSSESGTETQSSENTVDSTEEGTSTGSEEETAFHVDFKIIGLKENEYPEINELVKSYFGSIRDRDFDTLNRIVKSDYVYTEDELPNSAVFTEDYLDITCYTLNGMVQDHYIVYVFYRMKIMNIDTPAPSLIRLNVFRDDDGSLFINNKKLDAEMEDYVKRMDNNEDVRILASNVNRELKIACAWDSALGTFYDKILRQTREPSGPGQTMQSGDDESSSEGEQGSESVDESGSESVSESGPESLPESSSAEKGLLYDESDE